jgi:hypothetical protein
MRGMHHPRAPTVRPLLPIRKLLAGAVGAGE